MKTFSIIVATVIISVVGSYPTYEFLRSSPLEEASAVGKTKAECECPTTQTCCEISPGKYGCCPESNAVCCSDGTHCCPKDFKCNEATGKCERTVASVPILTKQPSLLAVASICPDGKSECLTGQTCCKLSTGKYGCCPKPNAVCCSDGVHCCAEGYTCDEAKQKCVNSLSSVPMLTKQPALPANSVCPDGKSKCLADQTCCEISGGKHGCCPEPNATCCSDGVHCCPHGYKCDERKGKCEKSLSFMPMLSKQPSLSGEEDEICGDGESKCPTGQTCCELNTGKYGCCPKPNAVCCSDGIHCCDEGYRCDEAEQKCVNSLSSVPMLTKQPALPANSLCPDRKSECPTDQTCCELSTGKYGCCPQPNAVCCSDGVHCCPHGYKCDEATQKCQDTLSSSSVPMLTKRPALPIISQYNGERNKVCPDGSSECPSGNTCCLLSNGKWGCCAIADAVCCSDGIHCCPQYTTCNLATKHCDSVVEVKAVPLSPTSSLQPVVGDPQSVVCPNNKVSCPVKCCAVSSGRSGTSYMCCPLSINAVCCSSTLSYCCPAGQQCVVNKDNSVSCKKTTEELSKVSWLDYIDKGQL